MERASQCQRIDPRQLPLAACDLGEGVALWFRIPEQSKRPMAQGGLFQNLLVMIFLK
jgi:hypothetical protein